MTQAKKRIDWIDYAKGIGIVLVVLGHVLRGLSDSVGLAHWRELQTIDAWIYSFHMPFFFFLSGVFANRSENKTVPAFLLDKLRMILYPYVIWSGAVGALRAILGQSGVSLSSFISNFWRIIYQPIDIFWFLYALFLISLIYFLLRKLNVAAIHILLSAILLYGIYLFYPQILLWNPLGKISIYSTYYVSGAILGNWLLNQPHRSNLFLLIGSISGFVILSVAIHYHVLILKEPNQILSWVGITSCFLLAKLLHQLDWLGFLKKWGCLSLQIYVVHTTATGLTRIILQKAFHVDEILVYVFLGVGVGICVPILLNWIVEKMNFPYLFFYPKQAKRT